MVGLDGRMLVEFSVARTPIGGGFINDGDYLDIEESKVDKQTGSISSQIILEAVSIAHVRLLEPNKTVLFIDRYVPVSQFLPRRSRLMGGYLFTLRLTQEEYDILQDARHRGNPLDIIKLSKRDIETSMKRKKKI